MTNEFDDFARKLQEEIYEETRKSYGPVAFQRWLKPLYMAAMDNPDGYGRITGPCGDTMQIFLKFKNGRVKEATFQTNGCRSSVVCGSFAAELALGLDLDGLAEITGDTVLEILGGLPEEDRHCAFLAVETLQEAIDDYMCKRHGKEHPHKAESLKNLS